MALNHAECLRLTGAFAARDLPLWVAYYRRALPRFTLVRDLLRDGAIGRVTSVQVQVLKPLSAGGPPRRGASTRRSPAPACSSISGRTASTCSISCSARSSRRGALRQHRRRLPRGRRHRGRLRLRRRRARHGDLELQRVRVHGSLDAQGTEGSLVTPVFSDSNVVVRRTGAEDVHAPHQPPHVHQPLIQAIVDELRGGPAAPSTGESAARTAWVMDRCVAGYYERLPDAVSGMRDPGSAGASPALTRIPSA